MTFTYISIFFLSFDNLVIFALIYVRRSGFSASVNADFIFSFESSFAVVQIVLTPPGFFFLLNPVDSFKILLGNSEYLFALIFRYIYLSC